MIWLARLALCLWILVAGTVTGEIIELPGPGDDGDIRWLWLLVGWGTWTGLVMSGNALASWLHQRLSDEPRDWTDIFE